MCVDECLCVILFEKISWCVCVCIRNQVAHRGWLSTYHVGILLMINRIIKQISL